MSEQVKKVKSRSTEYMSVARVRQHLDKHNINKNYYVAIKEIEDCKELELLSDKTKWLIIQGRLLFDSEQPKPIGDKSKPKSIVYALKDIAHITTVTKGDHSKYKKDLAEFKKKGGDAKLKDYLKYESDLVEFTEKLGDDKKKEEKVKIFKSKNKVGKVSVPSLKTSFDKAKFYVNKLKYRFSPPALSGISFTLDEAEKEILSAGIDNTISQDKKIIKKEHLLNLRSTSSTNEFTVTPLFETLSIAKFLSDTPIYKEKLDELINAEKKKCISHIKSLENSIKDLKDKLRESKKKKSSKSKPPTEPEAKIGAIIDPKTNEVGQKTKTKNEKHVKLTFKHYSHKLFLDVQREKIEKLVNEIKQTESVSDGKVVVDETLKKTNEELITKIKELKLGDDAKALCSDMVIEFLMKLSVMISDLLPFSKMKTFKSKLAFALIKSFISSTPTDKSSKYLSKKEFLVKLKAVIYNKEKELKDSRVYSA